MTSKFPDVFKKGYRHRPRRREREISGRTVTWAYLLALGMIAVMTVISHIMTAHITTRQIEGVEIAYKINRQRALVQDVVIHAGSYFEYGDKLDLDFLNQSMRELREGHNFLIRMVNQQDVWGHRDSPALYAIFFQPPFAADASFNKFMDATAFFVSLSVKEPAVARRAVLNEISSQLSAAVTRGLDVALENYQSEAMARIDVYARMQLYSVVLVLFVLALEGLLIFRPLVRRLEGYHQMLRRYALEDHLTGLNNRRAFMKRASGELQRAGRSGETVVVVLSDLDRFKSINDTYGHKVGDTVLRHFAEHMQKILRTEDVIGRIGGEEFAILLPRTSAEMGYQTIDRLREVIACTACPYVDEAGQAQLLSYTASFGLVVTDGKGVNIDDLLALADTGLYQAKDRGRNCVVPVDSGQPAADSPAAPVPAAKNPPVSLEIG